MPVDHLESLHEKRCHGFWNKNLLRLADPQSAEEQPTWLFVLSQMDYQLQSRNLGQANFVALLAEKLEQTKNLSRRPILIGPVELTEHLKCRLSTQYHHSLFSNSSYAKFLELLVSSEHVFYWNMISHSMYVRLVLSKPTHFFDRGHVAYMFPRLHRRAIQTYYNGTEPTLNAMDQPLDLDVLAQQAVDLRQNVSRMLERMKSFSSPDSLVNQTAALRDSFASH